MRFEEVVNMYSEKLFNFVFGMIGNYDDASDVAQETLFLAYKAYQRFRGDCAVYTWLYKIAKNECYKYFNKRKTMPLHLETEMPDTSTETQTELKLKIQKIVASLPQEYREPIVLKYFNEMSYEEIAETINTPIGTVRSRLARGKEMMQKKLNLNSDRVMVGNIKQEPEIIQSQA